MTSANLRRAPSDGLAQSREANRIAERGLHPTEIAACVGVRPKAGDETPHHQRAARKGETAAPPPLNAEIQQLNGLPNIIAVDEQGARPQASTSCHSNAVISLRSVWRIRCKLRNRPC